MRIGLGCLAQRQLLDRRIERGIERAGQDPAEIAALLRRRALRELLGEGGEGGAAPQLLDHAVGAALGLVGLVDPVDRDEDLGDPRLRSCRRWRGCAASASSISASDTSTCGRTLRRTILAQAMLRLDLLRGDLEGDADALQILLELAALHAGGALDLGDPLVDLRLGRLHAERLGILDLQPLVDHLPQDLRRQALLQVG